MLYSTLEMAQVHNELWRPCREGFVKVAVSAEEER